MPKTFWEILKTMISAFSDIKISSVSYETPVKTLFSFLHSGINNNETRGHVFRTVAIWTQPQPAISLHQLPKRHCGFGRAGLFQVCVFIFWSLDSSRGTGTLATLEYSNIGLELRLRVTLPNSLFSHDSSVAHNDNLISCQRNQQSFCPLYLFLIA